MRAVAPSAERKQQQRRAEDAQHGVAQHHLGALRLERPRLRLAVPDEVQQRLGRWRHEARVRISTRSNQSTQHVWPTAQ